MPSSVQFTLLLLALTKLTKRMVLSKEMSSKRDMKEKGISRERVRCFQHKPSASLLMVHIMMFFTTVSHDRYYYSSITARAHTVAWQL